MSYLARSCRWLMMVAMLLGAFRPLEAHDHSCLPAAGRRWAVLVIEDHPGMREVVWDPAFTNTAMQGAFRPDHRYALRTTGTPALIDLGCWDESFHYGGDHCGEHEGEDDSDRDNHSGGSVINVSWTGDRKGVILRVGGKSTWLPMLGSWDSKGTPSGTYRGAYLNWLLQNRPTTPSIPKETRWQRLQRGANALATQLLTRSGGAPEFRIEGIGASGRLLIPPGEGLPAAQNAVARMAPAAKGYALKDALNGVVEMVRDLKTRGGCQPGLVIVISDGFGLGSNCGSGSPYENQAQYSVLQQQATTIAATAQAAVWAWDVEGPSPWNPLLAAKGMGLSFDGDAVASLQASAKSWMQGMGQPPQVRLSLDQPALTRFPQATLTITVDRPLSGATLNGQALSITALTTQVPQTLKEGLNTFGVTVQTPCGSNQATLTVTLDSSAPKIILDQAPPALTNQATLRLSGRVDDPTSRLLLNGVSTTLDAQGRFAVDANLPVEGDNPLAFAAVDSAGNEGRLELHVVRDSVAPVVTLSSPEEGLITRAEQVDVVGHVDDSHAQVQVNGQIVVVKPDGIFSGPLVLPEGPMEIRVTAADVAGNQGTATRRIIVDRTAPKITLDQPIPSLVASVQLHLSGTVDDPSAVFQLNELAVPLDAQGRFAVDFPLVEGANPLSFRAVDAAGNEGALEGSTTRDTTAPVLVLVTPAESQRVNTAQVNLVGQLDDPTAMVTVNGQPVVPVGGTFSFTATPAEGPFSFSVAAVDPAGNASEAVRNVVIDRSGPVITLIPPVPALTNLLALTLQGRVNDPSASLTMNGVAVPLDGSGGFSVSVPLVEGANTFHFAAQDAVGNPGALDAATIRDTTAPVITLDTPTNGLVTNQGTLLVQGRVDDASARLTLNGGVVTLDAQGGFSATWALPMNGINNLSLQATDAAGNTGSLGIAVLRDAVPPKVTLTAPAEGLATRAATIQVEGQVDKPDVQVSVNGVGAILDANGHFVATLAPSEGSYAIQATAVDVAGNSGSATRTIMVDRTAPVITLSQGVPALTNVKTMTLTGTVDDPKATLALNGQAVAVDPAGAFTTTASLPTEGMNTLTFEATDLVGNVGDLAITTVRDIIPPVITILSPNEGMGTNQRSLVVEGKADDPSATLTLQGLAIPVNSDGTWEGFINATKEGPLAIRAEATDLAGNKGQAVVYAVFDWTPPTLAWTDPTPAEKSQLLTSEVPAAVVVSEPALVAINGLTALPEPQDAPGAIFMARADVQLSEGHMALDAEAVDRAGNKASILRLLDVGLTKPTLQVTAPTFQADGTYSTSNPGVQITGLVTAPEGLKPVALTLNGASVTLDASGRFSLPMDLVLGQNPVHLVARTSVGQSVTQDYTIIRTAGGPGDPNDPAAPGVQILWPLEGFATGSASMSVRGRVNQPGLQVTVSGMPASVDPLALTFTQNVTLVPGPNSIQVVATASDSRSASTQVRGSYVQPGTATYQWDLPANGARVKTREITLSGRADQPGILGVTVNGIPMSLAAGPAGQATFTGSLILPPKGRNALLMEVRTLAGDTRTERRDVVFEPELPRILLSTPDAARPGQDITLSVQPDGTTQLQAVDLSWNGRLLGRLTPPFAAVQATVPADAVVGTKLPVEAVATDLQGEVVTARAFVTVYGQGALLSEAFDDRTGLLLKEGIATVEGGESRPLDANGRATLATALPTSWVVVEKAGMTPVWRSAGLKVGGVEAIADARLTPMDPAQSAGPGAFTGGFGKALTLTLPAGTLTQATQVSCTPLSTHGLPALLPAGWSAVSAWWLDGQGASFQAPGATAALSAESLAVLPADARLAWARWDATSHQWTVQAPSLHVADCANLAMPSSGGYALVMADPGATAPPEAVLGSALPAYLGATWREGLKAAGSVTPSILPTVEAIHGVRATAEFRLTFEGGDPIPSGLVLQTDTLESYTLMDDRLIEPDSSTQDAVASRWMLEVVDGQPRVTGAGEGLAMRLPLRMSRTFGESELVEGRIVVGFYHDGVQVAQGGSTLMGPQGGTLNQDGLTLTFDQGAFSGSTLVRLSVIPGDPAALWADVAGQGAIVKSFQVDIVGQLFKGMRLKIAGLGSPAQVPILVQRRMVQGQRLVVAVGGLQPVAGSLGDWELAIPAEGNPLLEGGSFAILVPTQTWAWVTGTAVMDPGLAQGLKARAGAAKSLRLAQAVAGEPTPVGDAVVQAGNLPAVSGLDGHFAVPVFTTPATNTLQGQRWDLGVSGSLDVAVPSNGNRLQLSSVPFQVVTALPAEGAQVAPGSVVTLLLSGPADPMTTSNARLYRVVPVPQVAPTGLKATAKKGSKSSVASKPKSKAKPKVSAKRSKTALLLQEPTPTDLVEVVLRRNLSQDGKTLLLTPDQPLALGTSYVLVVDGLQSLGGQTAPQLVRTFKTTPRALPSVVDFSRFKVSYPDPQLNVMVTVPMGAVPARATVQVEAPEMGAVGAGVMPEGQALVFQLKAALGQRLTARVQLYSGEVIEGFLSRYESTDGSGRVTLGIDGGRVEAPGGSGAAADFPMGAFDVPVELRAAFLLDAPEDLLPALSQAERILGRVQVLADHAVILKKRPVLTFPATEAKDYPRPSCLGTHAVLYKVLGADPSGKPVPWFELQDTAEVVDGVLRSEGRLPDPLLSPASLEAPPVWDAGENGLLLEATVLDAGDLWLRGHVDWAIEGEAERPAAGTLLVVSEHPPESLQGLIVGRVGPEGDVALPSLAAWEGLRRGTPAWLVDPISGLITSAGGSGGLVQTPSALKIMQGLRVESESPLMWSPLLWWSTLWAVQWWDSMLSPGLMNIKFKAKPAQMLDHTAPYGELTFVGAATKPAGSAWSDWTVAYGESLKARLRGRDNMEGGIGTVLSIAVAVDGTFLKGYDRWTLKNPDRISGGLGEWDAPLGQLSEGSHLIEAFLKDSAGNETRLSQRILVLDGGGNELASCDGAPTVSLSLDGDANSVRPDTRIRVDFSCPVTGVIPTNLWLEREENGVFVKWLDWKLHMFESETKAWRVYIRPYAALEAGKRYRVCWNSMIRAAQKDGLPVTEGSRSFQVANWRVMSQVPGWGGQATAVGKRLFTAEANPARITWFEQEGDNLNAMGFFGPYEPVGTFPGRISEMKAFPGVTLGDGRVRDLLVVSTWPDISPEYFEFRVYVFDVCGAKPQLLFGVGMGTGVNGFVSGFDVRDGVLAISRLWSANAFVSISKAIQVWNTAQPSFRYTRYGQVAREAVFQYFHLVDPEHQDGTNWVNHKGLALLPAFGGIGESALRAAVGLVGSGYSKDGRPMTGLPVSIHFYEPGATYVPTDPYQGPEKGVDPRAFPGPKMPWAPYPEVVADVAAVVNGVAKTTNLLVAVEALGTAPGGNHLRILDEANPMNAQDVGHWPAEGEEPFGPGKAWSLDSRSATVDPATKLVAVKAKGPDGWAWFVLDVRNTTRPSVIAQVPFGGSASLMNGKLWLADSAAGLVRVLKVAPARIPIGGCGEEASLICGDEPESAELVIQRAIAETPAKTTDKDTEEPKDLLNADGTPQYSITSLPRKGASNQDPRFYLLRVRKGKGMTIKAVCVKLLAGSKGDWVLYDEPVGSDGFRQLSSGEVAAISWLKEPLGADEAMYKVRVTYPAGKSPGWNEKEPQANRIQYAFTLKAEREGNDLRSMPKSGDTPQYAHWRMPDGNIERYSPYAGAPSGNSDRDTGRNAGGDDWCSQRTYQWLAANYARIEPVNDISLEHGINEGHKWGHYNGNGVDMYHPGYASLGSTVKLGDVKAGEALHPRDISGTAYHAQLGEKIRLAQVEAKTDADKAAKSQAIADLQAWVPAARARLASLLGEAEPQPATQSSAKSDPIYRIRKILYLKAKTPQSDLLLDGDADLDIGEWEYGKEMVKKGIKRLILDPGHTHHAHVEFRDPSSPYETDH